MFCWNQLNGTITAPQMVMTNHSGHGHIVLIANETQAAFTLSPDECSLIITKKVDGERRELYESENFDEPNSFAEIKTVTANSLQVFRELLELSSDSHDVLDCIRKFQKLLDSKCFSI